ncbi:MAG: hypothetical protein AAFZ11_14975, partial [Pseudomonadota bacterium]
GRLALSDEGLAARDRYVVEQARQRRLPIASALGGGYGDDQREVAARHARSMLAMADANTAFETPHTSDSRSPAKPANAPEPVIQEHSDNGHY